MTFAQFASESIGLKNDRITPADAERQTSASIEILRRLDGQPGVVLADEVGMGKTFIALAVAASVSLQRMSAGPVVVMIPSNLRDKWPNDWSVFAKKCLSESARNQLRTAAAHNGIDFLQELGRKENRANIVFLTHGALRSSIGDPWAKLAVIKRGFKHRRKLTRQRKAFPDFAGRLLQVGGLTGATPALFADLLAGDYQNWHDIARHHELPPDVASRVAVPPALIRAFDRLDSAQLDAIARSLERLPIRSSDNVRDRLSVARRAIAEAVENVWAAALRNALFRSPLLILDEAHHAKNASTHLSRLMSQDAAEDSVTLSRIGAFAGKFERMLFLTATPFQLGHRELIEIVKRFDAINWSASRHPRMSRSEFHGELERLATTLDAAQAEAFRLDATWGRLDHSLLGNPATDVRTPEEWWAELSRAEGSSSPIVAQVRATETAIREAGSVLGRWVLRRTKSAHLERHVDVARRVELTGAAIVGGESTRGLDIPDSVLLPFLIAGRAQPLFARSQRGAAYFAGGLSSSFEAYLDTRESRQPVDGENDIAGKQPSDELAWYLEHVAKALPRRRSGALSDHPKIRATANRALSLWRQGHKVLIFSHYRATGRALRRHISQLLESAIATTARDRLGTRIDSTTARVTVDRIGKTLAASGSLRRRADEWVQSVVSEFAGLSESDRARIREVVLRFIRAPSFVARYLPLDRKQLAIAFSEQNATSTLAPLRAEVRRFCAFLAEHCTPDERADYLAALDNVQTVSHSSRDLRATFDENELSERRNEILLPNVRLANGEVRQETRRRLLLAFNTPLFPEILIASDVMAEGVDLHRNCRHVIHHDLAWNPSVLEQRTGRLDRIGCKAEQDGQSIEVYLPYLAATHDEKMYRVVRDRERWFQVIMGERFTVDESATDSAEMRIPLPRQVQEALTMRLDATGPR